MPIKLLLGRQIFDSTGKPTIEVDMVTELGLFRMAIPSTDLKKSAEPCDLRDNKPDEYHGCGVTCAVKNINTIIAPELIKQNLEVTQQREIDNFMIALDGTENRSRIGANAILAVSLVCAKAAAAKKGVPLYRHISDMANVSTVTLPVPHFTVFTGGRLSSNGLPFQEYLVLPTGASSFQEAMKIGMEVTYYIKKAIISKYNMENTYASESGGFSIPLTSHRDALLFLNDVLKQCNVIGKAEIGLNAVGDDMFKDGAYDLEFKNRNSNPQEYLTSDSLAEVYLDNIKEFPVRSVQDGFEHDDWGAWSTLVTRIYPAQLIGNDLTQTNLRRIGLAVEKKAATAVTLRLNQNSTLTELLDCVKILKTNGLGIVCESRWGDTNDLFLADLVVGLGAGQLKCGGLARGENVDKYNQIFRIEDELGALAKYAGRSIVVQPS